MTFEYKIINGFNAVKMARNANDVYGPSAINKHAVRFWFGCYRFENFDIINKSFGRPETILDNSDQKALVTVDSSQNMLHFTTTSIVIQCLIKKNGYSSLTFELSNFDHKLH